jgi:hypothetical protein
VWRFWKGVFLVLTYQGTEKPRRGANSAANGRALQRCQGN